MWELVDSHVTPFCITYDVILVMGVALDAIMRARTDGAYLLLGLSDTETRLLT